jgi:hypothetical protein
MVVEDPVTELDVLDKKTDDLNAPVSYKVSNHNNIAL